MTDNRTYLQKRDDDMEEQLAELRRKHEAEKSGADRLRDRLAYVEKLRGSAKGARELAEWLNLYMQGGYPMSNDYKTPPTIKRVGRFFKVIFGSHSFTMDKKQAASLFTWSMEHARAVAANADRIEAELAEKMADDD